jgi:hypothetical protein
MGRVDVSRHSLSFDDEPIMTLTAITPETFIIQ